MAAIAYHQLVWVCVCLSALPALLSCGFCSLGRSERCAATSFSQVGSPAEPHHQIGSVESIGFFEFTSFFHSFSFSLRICSSCRLVVVRALLRAGVGAPFDWPETKQVERVSTTRRP